jgi:hypothetical protein
MPQLIQTPEQVLRETKRDLYFIRFKDAALGSSTKKIPGRREILAWFKRELPHVELEDLAPSEASGWIGGSAGVLLRIAFDESSVAKYSEVWEHADGSSKDPRWGCYCCSYKDFLKHDSSKRR